MQTYQLHLMFNGGGIESIEIFDAASDMDAVALVQSLPSQGPKDLWQGSRRVRTFAVGHGTFQTRRFPFAAGDKSDSDEEGCSSSTSS